MGYLRRIGMRQLASVNTKNNQSDQRTRVARRCLGNLPEKVLR
jgi:hypothetical protein